MRRKEKMGVLKCIGAIALTLVVGGFVVNGMIWFGWATTNQWHDLGTVTQFQYHPVGLAWSNDYQNYIHTPDWTTANVTTQSHGVLHFDSRDKCPIGAPNDCASNSVSTWYLNQTLGIVYKNGGWYEATDP